MQMNRCRRFGTRTPLKGKCPRRGAAYARTPAEQVAERCRSIDEFSHFAFSPSKTPAFMFVIRKEENTHELNIGA